MNQHLTSVEEIRAFNREYTNLIGLMNRYLLNSEFTLHEVRILFEIRETSNCTSKGLITKLDIDGGYLSRILKKLEKMELIIRQQFPEDLRVKVFTLTDQGNKELNKLIALSNDQINSLIGHLSDKEKDEMALSMKDILEKMGRSKKDKEAITAFSIRDELMPGDLGYLTYLHAKIYQEECGYDLEFEGYVCKTFFDFTKRYSPERDRFFIVEKDEEIIGNIAILGHSEEEAQLRWFLIAPEYRGLGLGQKLFQEAIAYCREKGFKKVWLLTTSDQEKATRMYTREGFELVSEEEINVWGRDLIDRKYELKMK